MNFAASFTLLLIMIIGFSCFSDAALPISQKMSDFRKKMLDKGYKAAVIVSEDEHQSEYVSSYDNRRAWISGFRGSSGVAVITQTNASLWTDSRYYLAAQKELDPAYWTLMKASDSDTPSIEQWLKSTLVAGDKVYQNSKFTSISSWKSREASLKENGIILDYNYDESAIPNDLIDEVWPSDERTPRSSNPLEIHEIRYAGKTVQQKIDLVIERMNQTSADIFVVTALDEIAWLFNLRGRNDLPNNPMFYAYALINANTKVHSLYTNQSRITAEIEKNLGSNVKVFNYEQIFNDIRENSNKNLKIWVAPQSSYAIYNAVVNKDNLLNVKASPVRSLKAVKDSIEIANIRRCQIRDSAYRVRHMYWLETEMKKGSIITEKTSAAKLAEIEAGDLSFRGVSFNAISAVGGNAAIVHYATENGDNSTLTKDKIYLLDAGAQFLDCSTDITRTHHYGTPTAEEIYAYTRVLQGSIDLANIVFPPGVYGSTIDVEARAALWRVGLDYGHGTGHGIGYYLSIHEAPPSTAYNSRRDYDEPFVVGMVQSDEPGYYEADKFGIRLETDIEVVEAKTKFNYNNRKYLTFDTLTLVPFEENLIDKCILTEAQVDWLNDYNKRIREKVGPLLQDKNVQNYLMEKTKTFQYPYQRSECKRPGFNGSNRLKSVDYSLLVVLSALLTLLH